MAANVEAITLTRSPMGAIGGLVAFDIRNGDVDTARSMLSKAAIPRAYRWMPVTNLPTNQAIAYADVLIKSALYQLNTHAATVGDAALRRKIAIVLGTARAVMTEMYRLEDTDLIPGETEPAVLTYVAPVGTATDPNPDPTWRVRANVEEDAKTILAANMDFTDDEKAIMSDIVLCAVGLPAVQGASLMACGHHYLSDAREKSRAFYKVIEGQFWKKDPTKSWFAAHEAQLQDAMWHKAAHPISIRLKLRWATSNDIAIKIRAAGAGSAASRLPAKEAALKTAETVLTLAANVRQFFDSFGGYLGTRRVEEAIMVANCYVPGVRAGGDDSVYQVGVAPNFQKPKGVPPTVVDRETALIYLDDLIKRNRDITATAFGFYEAYAASSLDMGGEDGGQTLSDAYSLKKLKSDCFAAYMAGREAFADYKMFKSRKRAAGEFTAPELGYA